MAKENPQSMKVSLGKPWMSVGFAIAIFDYHRVCKNRIQIPVNEIGILSFWCLLKSYMAIPTESVSQCLHPGHASLSRCAREVLGSRDEPAVSRTSAQGSGISQNFQTEFREILWILKTHEFLWDFNGISLKFESVFGDCIQICVCVEQSIHRWMDGWSPIPTRAVAAKMFSTNLHLHYLAQYISST